ncbi:MAG: helix-turn-helix domain-containing protein [Ramlibacter sp.]|nr:helix-turn-helix domain-containing protein [Ramlibacter sp.]
MKPRYKLHLDGSMTRLNQVRRTIHPEQIKAAIRMRGSSPSALADSMNRSRMLISNVIHGRSVSRPVAEKIAQFIGSKPHLLWPGKYTRRSGGITQ